MNRLSALATIRRAPGSVVADELTVRFAYGAAERARLEVDAFAEELGVHPDEVTIAEDTDRLGAVVGVTFEPHPVFFAYLSDEHADARLIVTEAEEVVA